MSFERDGFSVAVELLGRYRGRVDTLADIWGRPADRPAAVSLLLDAADAVDGYELARSVLPLLESSVKEVRDRRDRAGTELGWLRLAPVIADVSWQAAHQGRRKLSDEARPVLQRVAALAEVDDQYLWEWPYRTLLASPKGWSPTGKRAKKKMLERSQWLEPKKAFCPTQDAASPAAAATARALRLWPSGDAALNSHLALALACPRTDLSDDELRGLGRDPNRRLAALVLRVPELPPDIEAAAAGWSEAEHLVVVAVRDAAAGRLSAAGFDRAIHALNDHEVFDVFQREMFAAGLLSRAMQAALTLTDERISDLGFIAVTANAQRRFQSDDENVDESDREPSPLESLLRTLRPELLP